MKKRCLVLLAEGFEEIEALTPVDLLRRADCVVQTVSITNEKTVVGSHGIPVTADLTAEQLAVEEPFDLVLLPGGMPGSKNLDASPLVDRVLVSAVRQDAVISAICAAPLVLGRRGLLAGKRATCYPGFEGELRGATLLDVGVAIDGKIITASAMGEAEQFALALVSALCGVDAAEKVRASIHPRPFRQDGETVTATAVEENLDENGVVVREMGRKLLALLAEFGVPCQLAGVCEGASALRFDVIPEKRASVRLLASLTSDIAFTLGTGGVRMLIPVPGKNVVGIEVANPNRHVVMLSDLLAGEAFTAHSGALSAVIGENVEGEAVIADLKDAPHLLLAGATGSGKSISIHGMLVSLMTKYTPDQVRLLLIDPKRIEFDAYKDAPHLLVPVIGDAKGGCKALEWAVGEMERRLALFSAHARETGEAVRNLTVYNEMASAAGYRPLPRLVIVIDELADLMLTAREAVERSMQRLTQLARATGIHLIIGTQRPSLEVLTGSIRANIPSRIAFSTVSAVDSRTILDRSGAEQLSGHGDMLYFPCGAAEPIRVQGAYISEEAVAEAVEKQKKTHGNACYDEAVCQFLTEPLTPTFGVDTVQEMLDTDALFLEVLTFAVEAQKVSVSLLQRKFLLGFSRAARMVDRMEEMGFLSAADGVQPRRVLLTEEQLEAYKRAVTE